jgi:hypothetical protein
MTDEALNERPVFIDLTQVFSNYSYPDKEWTFLQTWGFKERPKGKWSAGSCGLTIDANEIRMMSDAKPWGDAPDFHPATCLMLKQGNPIYVSEKRSEVLQKINAATAIPS